MSKETTPIKEAEKLRSEIDGRLLYGVAADPATANTEEMYSALGLVSRAQLAKRWVQTQKEDRAKKSRRIYYLSMEFLIGRALNNALSALDLREPAEKVFSGEGAPTLTEVIECEPDAALGNGGLLPRFDGDAGVALLGLWHALRIRHVCPVDCQWLPGRAPG